MTELTHYNPGMLTDIQVEEISIRHALAFQSTRMKLASMLKIDSGDPKYKRGLDKQAAIAVLVSLNLARNNA